MEELSLLVRRSGSDRSGRVARLVGLLPEELDRCAHAGGLFILADIFWDASSDPLGVLVVTLDRASRRALVRGIAVPDGLADRLLRGAAGLLAADGIEAIEADGANAVLRPVLRCAGFREGADAQLLYWV